MRHWRRRQFRDYSPAEQVLHEQSYYLKRQRQQLREDVEILRARISHLQDVVSELSSENEKLRRPWWKRLLGR